MFIFFLLITNCVHLKIKKKIIINNKMSFIMRNNRLINNINSVKYFFKLLSVIFLVNKISK